MTVNRTKASQILTAVLFVAVTAPSTSVALLPLTALATVVRVVCAVSLKKKSVFVHE